MNAGSCPEGPYGDKVVLRCQYSASRSLSHCSSASLSLSQWSETSRPCLNPASRSQCRSALLGTSDALLRLKPLSRESSSLSQCNPSPLSSRKVLKSSRLIQQSRHGQLGGGRRPSTSITSWYGPAAFGWCGWLCCGWV